MSCGEIVAQGDGDGEIVAQGSGCYPDIGILGCCSQMIFPGPRFLSWRPQFSLSQDRIFVTTTSGGGGQNAFIGGDAITIPTPGPVPEFWTQAQSWYRNGFTGAGAGGFIGQSGGGSHHGGGIGSSGSIAVDQF